MNSKKKDNKWFKNIIGDLSGITWKDLDHKKVIGAAVLLVAVIVAVVVLIVKSVSGGKTQMTENSDNPAVVTGKVEEVVDDNPLEVDAYEGVNDLVFKYFYARCMGDIDMLKEVVDVLSDEEIETIERKKNYIEAYRHLQYYTKKGMEEGSFVVFASYEMKIYDIEALAPGIEALYVCTAEDGSLYVFNGEASEELTNYVLELAAEEDVAAVIADVDARYQKLVAEDEALGNFARTMLESQKEQAEEEPEAPATNENSATAELEDPITTKVNDGIRIREAHSTESRIIATIVRGTEVKVYASYEDGWSKIEYSGTKGFCKTEFLESTEGVPVLAVETEAEPEEEQTETTSTQETQTEAGTTVVNKEMQFKETVRIRKEPSTESERIGTGYENNLVKVIESYSDGWSKIDYNGTKGYCKTEYLEEAN